MDRHYLQLFVALVSELYRLSAGLLNFQLEDARVFLPAALRKAFLHVGQSGQSRFAFAGFLLTIAFFLLSVALLLFSITSFLFAVAALLLFVLGILRVLRTIPVGERNGRQPRG